MIAIIGNNLIYRIAEFYKNFCYFLRTVFIGLNTAAFIKFQRFQCSVYLRVEFILKFFFLTH